MSTEFRTRETDEWVCTRWWGGNEGGKSCDWGSEQQLSRWVEQSLNTGDVELTGEDGTSSTVLTLWCERRSTFGEFGGTVELGSGELLDRLGCGEVEQ